LKRTTSR